jgi:hypothetical protein
VYIPKKQHSMSMVIFNWKKYSGLFFLSAILILLFVVIWQNLLLFLSVSEKSPFSLHFVIKSNTPQITTLYYDLGEGFSEKNTVNSVLSGDNRFHDCFFPIPKQSIQGFRFDPAKPTASLVIKKIDIVMEVARDFNITVKHIDLDDLKPAHQIKEFARQANQLTVATTDDADDPQIAIPIVASFDAWYPLEYFSLLIRMILKILVVGILSALLLWIWFRWDDQTSGIIALFALIVFGLRCVPIYYHVMTPFINVSIQSSTSGKMSLYYDFGRGFSEKDSESTIVVPDQNDRNYQIEIPLNRIFNLRIDPPASKDGFIIGKISVTDGLGHPTKPFNIHVEDAFPNEDVSGFRIAGARLFLWMQGNARDPQVIIPFASPLSIEIGIVHFLIKALFELLLIFVVAVTLVLICMSKKKYRLEIFIFVVSVGIVFLRYPDIILNPRFLAEEGSLFFRNAYHSVGFSISSLFNNHEIVGYYNLIADFAAWVAATFFSLPDAPYATLSISFLIQIIPLSIIITSLSPLWNSPLKKTLGSLLILLVPVSGEVWLNTLGSQFYLGLISFLILLESGNMISLWKKWLYRGLLLIGGFSGITSCLLTPFFFLKGVVHDRNRETFLQTALLMFTSTLQFLSLWYSSNTRLSNLGDPYSLIANTVNTNFVSTLLGPAVAKHLSQIIFGIYTNAYDALPYLLISLLVGEAIFLYFLSRRTNDPWLSITALGTIMITVIISYIGMLGSKWQTVDPYNAPRYFWLPNVVLALCIFFAIKEKASFSKTIRCNKFIAFILLFILINGILNYDMGNDYKKMPSWRNEVNLWMQSDEKKPIALWPQGWFVELKKK